MNKRFQILLPVITATFFFILCLLLFDLPDKAAEISYHGLNMPLLIFLIIAVMLSVAFLYKIITVKGLRLRWYLLAITLLAIFLTIFIKTISFQSRYRFFDPFLQMPPPLETTFFTTKDTNEVRILALGGSTTACKDLLPENRYPHLLQQKLQAKFPHKKIRVLNAGQEWFTTRHSLITYTNYYQTIDADIVLIKHAINDLYRSFTPLRFSKPVFICDYAHFFGASSHAALPEKSYIHHLITKAAHFWHKVVLQKNDIQCDFALTKYTSLKSYVYFYNLLMASVKFQNACPVIVSQPYLYNDNMTVEETASLWIAKEFCYNQSENNYKTYGKKIASVKSLALAMDAFNEKARRLAGLHGIPFVALEAALEKKGDNFSDDVHYTAQGAEKVAEIICNFVIENNLIK